MASVVGVATVSSRLSRDVVDKVEGDKVEYDVDNLSAASGDIGVDEDENLELYEFGVDEMSLVAFSPLADELVFRFFLLDLVRGTQGEKIFLNFVRNHDIL